MRAAGDGDRLYAQGHWGTFRSDDGGDSWTEITEGLPSDFGMVMAAHPSNPDVAYVLPLVGGEFRCPPEAKLRVYRTSDAGKTWEPMTRGLPQQEAYMGIYREGMAVDTMDQRRRLLRHQHGPALRQQGRRRHVAVHQGQPAADQQRQRCRHLSPARSSSLPPAAVQSVVTDVLVTLVLYDLINTLIDSVINEGIG